jgi:large subunit ribosomal protein L31e
MKVYDKDLNKIKLDKMINEVIWARGIKKPPHKIKVKAYKDGEVVRAELIDAPRKLTLKKTRLEKREQKATEKANKKKTLMQKTKETKKEKPEEKQEESKEVKEKKAAVKEEGKKIEKQAAKQMKHQSGGKTKQKTQPQRKALAR